MDILKYWDLLARVPGRAKIFNFCLRFAVPYTATLGAEVLELRPGFARLRLKDRRKNHNHLKSIHAAALMNLCEEASGLAVVASLGTKGRGILIGFNIEYVKKARGTLSVECASDVPEITQRVEHLAQAVVKDSVGDIVCKATAKWLLQPADFSSLK